MMEYEIDGFLEYHALRRREMLTEFRLENLKEIDRLRELRVNVILKKYAV
jgi:hypothetical protein